MPAAFGFAAVPFGGQSSRDGGPWNFGLPPHGWPHGGPLDDCGQFCQTVGNIAMLITKPLAGDQQLTISGEPRPLLLK